jgi:hypothetical protein
VVVTEGKGWGPLCEFLGLPIPEVPFPRSNDTAELQAKLVQVNYQHFHTVVHKQILTKCYVQFNTIGWVVGSLFAGLPLVYYALTTPTTGLNTAST